MVDDVEERRDLLGHPRADGRLGVVGTLHEGRPVEVADGVAGGRVRDEVVDVAVGRADPAVRHALDEVLDRHLDVAGSIDAAARLAERAVERLGLDARPWEAVEHGAIGRIGGFEAVEEDAHDGVVGHELAATHVPVSFATERRAGRDGGAEERTRCQDRDTESVGDRRRLGPLPRPRRTQQDDDTHDRRRGWTTRISG